VALTVYVWSQEVAIFGQTATNFGKIVGAQRFHVPFCPQNGREPQKTAQNEPKLRESCALWQKLRACTKTQKLRSATSQFSGGTNYKRMARGVPRQFGFSRWSSNFLVVICEFPQ